MWDFYPYKAFFKASPKRGFDIEGKIISDLNPKGDQIRYWAPFPYARHLPKYRQEYMTRYTYRNRINSSFLYIPFSPLYSGYLYDSIFTTALEPEIFDPQFIAVTLNWANVGFIVLQPEVRDYTYVINALRKYGFNINYISSDLIILKKDLPDTYVRVHSKVSQVPFERKDDIYYWINLTKQGVTPFFADRPLFFNPSDQEKTELVQWKHENQTVISIITTFTQPTLISLSESFYPGWSVSFDNKPAQLLRINYAFMGTIVPSGDHLVKFTYQKPWYYYAGMLVSISIIPLTFLIIKTSMHNNKYDN